MKILLFHYLYQVSTVSKCIDANCPPNEVCTNCFNPCFRSCETLLHKRVCTQFCETGPKCDCRENFYRNSNGKCVKAAECKTCTGKNEEWKDCYNNCTTSCKIGVGHGGCTKDCKGHGCDCKTGYYRNLKGVCVPLNECENYCPGKHEVYTDCYNNCTTSCEAGLGYVFCTTNCRNSGCDCDRGFYRHPYIGICVPLCECPRYCKDCHKCTDPNEEWTDCANSCLDSCGFATGERVCTKECKGGACECKRPYSRDPYTKKCVHKCDCPQSCKHCKGND